MNFHLCESDGTWVLVPDSILSTRAATRQRGSLAPVCEVGEECMDADELKSVLAWIDVERYAEISAETARRLIEEPRARPIEALVVAIAGDPPQANPGGSHGPSH